MPLASSSRGRPSPDVRAEDRAPPTPRQRAGRYDPGCLRSFECAVSFGRFRDRALRRPPLRRRLPREGGARSFVIRRRLRSSAFAGAPIRSSTFIDDTNWGEDLSSSFLQSSFQSMSDDRVRSRPACRLFLRQLTSSYEETAADSFSERAVDRLVRGREARAARPIRHLAARATKTTNLRYPDQPIDEHPSSLGARERRDRDLRSAASFAEELLSHARPRSLARVFCSRMLSSGVPHRWEPFIHKLITACGWIEGSLLETPRAGQ